MRHRRFVELLQDGERLAAVVAARLVVADVFVEWHAGLPAIGVTRRTTIIAQPTAADANLRQCPLAQAQSTTIRMNERDQAVWLITGAAGALGRALVEQCLQAGHDCIALDRNAAGLEALHDRLVEQFDRAPALMPMNLAGAAPEDYQQLAEVIEREFGRVDVLVHNAATFKALQPLQHQPPGEWLEIIQTSLTAPFMLNAVLSPLMSERARIVMIGDRHCLERPGRWGAYGIAQAGRRQMAAAMNAERVPSAARIIEVDPGPFYSPLRVAAWPSDSPQDLPTAADAAGQVMAAVNESENDDQEAS